MRFRGVAHVHSTLSFDGHLPLDRLAKFFSDRGLHFALVSEHVETLDPQKLQQLVKQCRECSTDSMVLIPGIEIDALNALFYGIAPVDGWTSDEDLARQLAAGGAMVVVSHPMKVKSELPELTSALVEGVEVWNTRHDGKLAVDLSVIRFWRSLERRLRRRVLPLCGIDFHGPGDFVSVTLQVDCERLDQAELFAALRSRRYTIARGSKTIPLDTLKGTLPFHYTLYSRAYRIAFDLAHVLNQATARIGIRVPSAMKARVRRMF